MPTIPEKSIDMILSDLPYGLTQNEWDSVIPLDKLWQEFKRVVKDNAVIALTASQPFTSMLIMSNLRMFKHEWIWQKNRGSNFANTVREPFKEHEAVLIFSAGKWTYNPQPQERGKGGLDRIKYAINLKTASTNYRQFPERTLIDAADTRVPSSVQKFNTEVGLHPTQKPTALFEYLIKTYSNEGDTVLDCCLGSGTSALAAAKLGRHFIGIEIDEEYYKIAKERLDPYLNTMRITQFQT